MIRVRDNGQRRAKEGHPRLKVQAAFFNADDGVVASTEPVWLQTVFDKLMGLFN